MAKMKLFASEYKDLITVFGIALVLIINVVTAAYAYGKLSTSLDDNKTFQTSQTSITKTVVDNLKDVTYSVQQLKTEVTLQGKRIARVEKAHKYPPIDWDDVPDVRVPK
jgi:hypothetical protein